MQAFASVCQFNNIDMPDIFSESGRALTAHHAVLITNVTEVEKHDLDVPDIDVNEPSLIELRNQLTALQQGSPLREIYHDVVFTMQEIQLRFNQGLISLQERAKAERLYYAICSLLQQKIDPANRSHHSIQHELNEILADKVFCNFSIFQSMPDVWAIDQVFPIVPLQRLHQEPERRAILHDLTCDSDGRIDHYVDSDRIENTLPLHNIEPGEEYYLGFFLVGAYQETLGDIHNLFGDTATVNIMHDDDGNVCLQNVFSGEDVSQLLNSVGYDPEKIRQQIIDKALASDLPEHDRNLLLNELQQSLQSYSYLVE